MTPDEKYLERQDRHAAILADFDKHRHGALVSEGGASIRWSIAAGITANSGGIALLASRAAVTAGDQVAMSLMVISIFGLLLTGWIDARSNGNTAAAIHVSLTERFASRANLKAERDKLHDLSKKQDRVVTTVGIASICVTLVGGLLGIWL